MPLVKKIVVTIVGVAVVVLGIALMPLPGPGLVVLVGGLAILASEYAWARRLLVTAKDRAQDAQQAAVASPIRTAGTFLFAAGLIAVGVATFVVDDVPWPVLDSWLDAAWSPVTGGVLAASGLLLVGTTIYAMRNARSPAAPEPTPAAGGARRVDRTDV